MHQSMPAGSIPLLGISKVFFHTVHNAAVQALTLIGMVTTTRQYNAFCLNTIKVKAVACGVVL